MYQQNLGWGVASGIGFVKIMGLSSVLTAVALFSAEQSVQGARLTSWQFNPATSQLEILVSEKTTPRYFLLSQPPRIVIDFPNSQLGNVETQKTYSGAVRQIRVAQFEAKVTRIVMELSPDIVLTPEKVQLQQVGSTFAGNRWILRPVIAGTPRISGESTADLPPASFPMPQMPSVKVPPLNGSQGATVNSTIPINLPPADLPTNPVPTVRVPSLQTGTTNPPIQVPATTRVPPRRVTVSTPASSLVIEFGQPLPK